MTITSSAFQHNEHIPSTYTCDGENVNPPLTFSEIPPGTESLALVVDDPDAPGGTFTHWLLYDMTPATLQILQNATPTTGLQGTNDFKQIGYGGPCPPSGTHRYFFRLLALSKRPRISAGATRAEFDTAIQESVLEVAQLVGLYECQNSSSESLDDRTDDYSDDRNTSDTQITTAQQAE